jgi:hypothetical protein
MRRALQQEVAQPVKSLRQACIERGIDPDNTGVKSTKQRWLNIDRIIPGVADSVSPSMHECFKNRPHKQARVMYTRTSAQNDALLIASAVDPVECYVAVFCRLNNLVAS